MASFAFFTLADASCCTCERFQSIGTAEVFFSPRDSPTATVKPSHFA